MGQTTVVLYRESDGSCPVVDWLRGLSEKPRGRMMDRIRRLRENGFELGMPMAKPLGDGLHELRGRVGNVRYRVLYSFHEGQVVLLSGFVKRGRAVPATEIRRAEGRRLAFGRDPDAHTLQSTII